MTTETAARGMRTFLIIWIGQLVSIIGSGLTAFGLAVWTFNETGQATPFALTVLFANLPRILLSPFAGAIVDRVDRRRVMILADVGSAVVTLGALLLLSAGLLEIWTIYVIAACYAVLSAFQEPAYSASVTLLVPQKDLARANGLIQTGHALQMIIAPLLAGAIFAFAGLNGIFLVDFITFFAAVGALLLVRIPRPPRSSEEADTDEPTSLWSEALFGWRYLRRRTGLLGLLIYFAVVNFCLNLAAVLLGPLVLSFSSAAVLGTVQTVSGVGMLAGSIFISAWGGPRRRVPGIIAFIAVAGLGLLVAGLFNSPFSIAAGLFILMFTIPGGGGLSQAVFQSKVEPAVQGRVFAFRSMVGQSMMPLAFLLAGPLADLVFEPLLAVDGALAGTPVGALLGTGPGRGIGLMFILASLLLLVASAAAAATPRIRDLEEELPDALPAQGATAI